MNCSSPPCGQEKEEKMHRRFKEDSGVPRIQLLRCSQMYSKHDESCEKAFHC